MSDLIREIVTNLVLLITALLGSILASYLRKSALLRGAQEQLQTKKELVRLAVLYAQQAWAELDGPERFEKAVEWLTEQANKVGLHFDYGEMRGLIEATVKELKKSFGDAWKK